MKRRNYIAPTMHVVVLKHESPLLVGSVKGPGDSSGAKGVQDNYGDAFTDTWEED